MILIKPNHKILYISPKPLEVIEAAGRTCYKSEKEITESSAKEFVKKRIKDGHLSVIEHAYMSVRFICDRGVTHEIVRHRLAAYSQESTRYCNYKGGVTFIIPPWVAINKADLHIIDNDIKGHHLDYSPDAAWLDSMLSSERIYKELISAGGWSPQQARSVLPNSLKTEIIMTANLREWMHVFKLRTSKVAHPQMRELMRPLLAEVKKRIPIIFDNCQERLKMVSWGELGRGMTDESYIGHLEDHIHFLTRLLLVIIEESDNPISVTTTTDWNEKGE